MQQKLKEMWLHMNVLYVLNIIIIIVKKLFYRSDLYTLS